MPELSTLGIDIAAALEGLSGTAKLDQDAIENLVTVIAAKAARWPLLSVTGARTLQATDEAILDMLTADAVLTIADQASIAYPEAMSLLVRFAAGGTIVAPGAASIVGTTGDSLEVDAPLASEIKAVRLFRVADDLWWAVPTGGDADIAALSSAVAANTAAIATKAPAVHQHSVDDLNDASTDVAALLSAQDAAEARAAILAGLAPTAVTLAGEAVDLLASHNEVMLVLTGSSPTLTIQLDAGGSYPAVQWTSALFVSAGYVAIETGGSINGQTNPAAMAVPAYGIVGLVRIGANSWVVGDPNSGGGGGEIGLPIAMTDVVGLPDALAAKYSDPETVAAALEGRTAANRLITLDAHSEALKGAPGLLWVPGIGEQISTKPIVVKPAVTYAQLVGDTWAGTAVYPDALIDPLIFREVTSVGGAQTIDPAVLGGPNILINTAQATDLVTLVATPDPWMIVGFWNVGGGTRDVSLISSGASGYLSIEFGLGVDNTLNLGATAGDWIFFHLMKPKPSAELAIVTGITVR